MPKRELAIYRGQQGPNSSTIDGDDQMPKAFSFSKRRSFRWPAWLGCCFAAANMTKQNIEQWRCGSAPRRCRKRRAQRIRGTRPPRWGGGQMESGRGGPCTVAGQLRDVDAFELWLRWQLPARKGSPKPSVANLMLSQKGGPSWLRRCPRWSPRKNC